MTRVTRRARRAARRLIDPIVLAQGLIRCASVTPADDGAQDLLAGVLAAEGFVIHRLPFGQTPNVFARIGTGTPHFCFAGHTDVVPPGSGWRHDPFGGVIEHGVLYGRGACDMKGAIAAFASAAASYLAQEAPTRGSISLLITGDEEGPALDGTVRVLGWMADQGQIPDACIVGEPTNPLFMGEMVKVGRRGSLNATITVNGVQGHAAYPKRASNPVHPLIASLAALTSAVLDDGSAFFEPSSLQVTSVDVGNQAFNVIPAQASARLNIRFNDRHTGASLTGWLRDIVAQHAQGALVEVQVSGEAFRTEPGPMLDLVCAVIERETGHAPLRDTSGGTSDARFIAKYAPVIEFGLVGATIHQANECVAMSDLLALTSIYGAMLREFLI